MSPLLPPWSIWYKRLVINPHCLFRTSFMKVKVLRDFIGLGSGKGIVLAS